MNTWDIAIKTDQEENNMSIVYKTKEITPEGLVRVYEALGVSLKGNIAIKISTGEPGGHNFLQPGLIKDLVNRLSGTIVECNTAYPGRRNTCLLYTSGITWRKVGMTSNHHAPYDLGYTRATMA